MQNVLFFLLISLSTLSCKSQELGSTTSSDSKFTEKEATQQFPDEPQSDQVITKIALGSCYQPHYRKANIWSIITKQSPQLFLFMGDNIYADTTDMDKLRSIYQKLNNQPDYAGLWDQRLRSRTQKEKRISRKLPKRLLRNLPQRAPRPPNPRHLSQLHQRS